MIWIIILNWNNAPDTINCLDSLFKIHYKETVLLVVDNASTDGSLEKIRSWCNSNNITHQVHLLSLPENQGFAGGNNAGIKYAIDRKADYVLLLNNDTLVPPDFLAQMVATIQNDPQIGVLGCRIYHFPEQQKIWFNGGRIDYLRGFGTHFKDSFEGLRECDFITGCLMLIPVKVLQKSGLFDERYFLIAEDSDLSQRIKKAGYKVTIDTHVHIHHKISSTMGGFYSPLTQYYFHRNRMLFMMSILTVWQKVPFLLFQFLIVIPLWSLTEIIKGKSRYVLWAWRGYCDFLTNTFGKAKYFS